MKNSWGRTRVNTVLRSAKMALPILLILVAISSVPLFAQERFGEINGTVTDSSGAVLPNATVTLSNKESGRVYNIKAGGDGSYIARQLDPGRYSIKIENPGFSTYEAPDVLLLVGKTLKMDAALQVGSTGQTVQVTEASPLIDVTGVAVNHNITAEEFDHLPKARSFQSLAALSPSVNTGQIENGFQINGASGAENQFTIDGISTNSVVDGRSRQDAVFEFLQEVEVKTGGIEAEYGGAQGGVISAITKTGGNAFHGDIHYYFSGNALNAGPVQRLLLNPQNETTVTYVQDHKNKDNRNEVGYSIGGPILKNKIFFFSAASPRWVRRSEDYLLAAEPGVRDTTEQKQTFWQVFNKITLIPNQRVRANFAWLYTPTKSVGRLSAFGDQGNTTTSTSFVQNVNHGVGFFAPQSSYTGNIDVTLTRNSLLSVRGGYFWDDYKDTGIPGVSAIQYQATALGLPFTSSIPANLRLGSGAAVNVPRLQNTFHDLTTRAFGQVDYSVFGHFLGQHDLKIGAGLQKIVNNVDVGYPGGGYVFVFWDKSYTSNATKQTQRGTYGYYEVDDIGTRGTTGAGIKNMYIQDKWRITPRLTLSLGLRTEDEKIPSFRRDIKDYAFQFGWADKIAPRLGATYDLLGNGKVKLYGSWGRYFDWVKYELARGTFGGDFWTVRYRALDTTDVLSLSGTNTPGKNIYSDVPGSVRNRRVPGFDTIDPLIKPMYSDLTNIGTEFQLSNNMVFRAGYVRNHLGRTIEDLGVLVNGDEVYAYANPGEGGAKTTPVSGGSKPFPTPKPVRNYNALELSITKRFSNRWFGSASYVFSRLYGNYPGLANSDEIRTPTSGSSYGTTQQASGSIARQGSSASRAWDIDELLWDSRGHLDVQGNLPTDRPHVVKLYGSYSFKWGTEIAANWYGGSGTPLSTYVNTINQTEVFVNGRGDMGRTPFLSQTDMVIAHEVKLGEVRRLRFEANALNLFNQKTARHRFVDLNRSRASSAIDLGNVDLAKGYDYKAMINASSEGAKAYDPRYGMADLFNPGFSGRLGVKFIF
jgi:hypothetical protein